MNNILNTWIKGICQLVGKMLRSFFVCIFRWFACYGNQLLKNQEAHQTAYMASTPSISESNAMPLHVELSIVFAQKHIPQNPERSTGRWQVHGNERRGADPSILVDIPKDILVRLQEKSTPTQGKGDFGQVWYAVARNKSKFQILGQRRV